ncbi:ubiquitin carboxyl-terminal hydrolase 2-like isoform X1 [Iris pallida]|uniref:Ubiquitin carboxyl-terminal hydrolase n=1 Tax=Iris pallida TaxID=29817 RepID=A0AAX6H6T6_IRIPA|nr:ubiquitin carboxyl-terminal hydrolase 2-like isoform X1 [Iris pallida]
MGKKVKKKAPNPRRALHRATAGVARPSDRTAESGDEAERPGEACSHYSRTVAELNQVLSKIRADSDSVVSCEHCREEPVQGRGSKEKGKQSKRKGGARVSEVKSESNFIWVCLDCSRYLCGGEVSTSEPYGHARRHSKQEKHLWAVRSDDPLVSWCYVCSSKVPIEMPPEEACDDPKPAGELDNGADPFALGSTKGYVVRGLSNLGNTCFFNSVMQNLLATNLPRDYLLGSESPFGPITIALRKIFIETSSLADTKNVMSPKALFGSICAKQPQFRGYQQQDSHELLRYLLAELDVEELSYRKLHNSSDEEKVDAKPNVTFVDAIFAGQTSSTVCCTECGFTSVVHEPFLDLSLPVPSKKPSPNKKVPPQPPKRGKQPLKERNKGRKFREKGVAKTSPSGELGKGESSELPSASTASVGPKPEQVEVISERTEDDYTWMDFLNDPGPMIFEDDAVQGADTEQVPQSTAQCTSDSQLKECSVDLVVPSESCGENSCGDLMTSPCVEASSIQLLKESDPTLEGTNSTSSCSQTVENVAFFGAPVEEEFDGFGDMFNEPEVTSASKKENAVGEDMDLTLCTGNSSESNQDEVDNTNSPVSINSCLALFTKPELLSDEQAWHCERCSENVGPKTGKLKTDEALNEGKLRSKNSSPNIEVVSSSLEVLGNRNTSTSKNLAPEVGGLDDPSTIENTSQKPLDSAGGSDSNGDVQNDGSSNSLGTDISQKDPKAVESDNTSQYQSCSSVFRNTVTEESSMNQDSGLCGMNDLDGAGCDGELKLTFSSACENDTKSKVNQPEKCLQLLEKGHPVAGNKGDEVKSETKKVKRDATKRILIYRTPPILTIHLKRFSQDARGRLSKLSGHVGFSEELDLRSYMDPRSEEKDKCQYRLIGVVEHSGSMSGGHYIAYVRGERGRGKTQKSSNPGWFYASDAYVREASLSEVLNSDAYILFYERGLT